MKTKRLLLGVAKDKKELAKFILEFWDDNVPIIIEKRLTSYSILKDVKEE